MAFECDRKPTSSNIHENLPVLRSEDFDVEVGIPAAIMFDRIGSLSPIHTPVKVT